VKQKNRGYAGNDRNPTGMQNPEKRKSVQKKDKASTAEASAGAGTWKPGKSFGSGWLYDSWRKLISIVGGGGNGG